MDIGTLQIVDDGNTVQVRGQITTLAVHAQIRLQPFTPDEGVTATDRHPTHDVIAKGAHGQGVRIGAAWAKTIQKEGPTKGDRFFSMTLDDPGWSEPINCTAFLKRNSETDFRIAFDRRRGGTGTAAPVVDDEIPF